MSARLDHLVRTSDGIGLHVAEYGAARGRSPVTLVLLHGWTLDHRLWTHQLDALPARLGGHVRILAVDLRGHGASEGCAATDTTLRRLADDVHAVLRELAPKGSVVLAGHSLGGMAIIEYAHRHPAEFARRVRGAVLVSTSAEGAAHTTYGLGPLLGAGLRTLETNGAALLARLGPWRPHKPIMPALWPAVRWLVYGDHAPCEAMRLTLAMISRASLRSIGGFRPSIGSMNRVDALRALDRLPVAVLVGTRDRLTPVKCTEAMTTALPHAELSVLEGCGHMPPLECPEAVTAALARVCRAAAKRHPVPERRRAEPERSARPVPRDRTPAVV